MKIQLVSDLHMEFAPIEIVNAGADVLILSGDIVVADYFTRGEASPKRVLANEWLTWFEATCAQFERVYYVLGNHEHYNGRFYETANVLMNALGHIRNLVILDNAYDFYEGFAFVGTTLWTDFDHDNLKAMMVRDGLNDYKLIQGTNYRKLLPAETALYNAEALRVINYVHEIGRPVIVVGHHGPSYRSVSEDYRTGMWSYLNPGYVSHLDKFIEERPNIRLWTHGHVHSSHHYQIGATQVAANPRGYAKPSGDSENAQFDPNLLLEVRHRAD